MTHPSKTEYERGTAANILDRYHQDLLLIFAGCVIMGIMRLATDQRRRQRLQDIDRKSGDLLGSIVRAPSGRIIGRDAVNHRSAPMASADARPSPPVGSASDL
jgi:hypothetical protein